MWRYDPFPTLTPFPRVIDGLEMEIVSHDVKKFFGLLLKKNGFVLEQLYSPLVVHTTVEHAEWKEIAKGCITRHHSHHYFGFAETQWKLFDKERPVNHALTHFSVPANFNLWLQK